MTSEIALIRPGTTEDAPAHAGIDAWYVQYGTGTSVIEVPGILEIASRRDAVVSKGLPCTGAAQPAGN